MRQVRRDPARRGAVLPEMRQAGKLASKIARGCGGSAGSDPAATTYATNHRRDSACCVEEITEGVLMLSDYLCGLGIYDEAE